MRLIEHAKREFKHAGWMDENGNYEDEMQEAICNDILEILQVLSKQGHSGSSMCYLLPRLNTLVNFKPLTTLTGEDDEWTPLGDGRFQNKRCSTIFKDEEGKAYDIEGVVFVDKDGNAFTNAHSRVRIKFPYTPRTVYNYEGKTGNVTINGVTIKAPKGALAYKFNDPTEDAKWLYTEEEIREIEKEDTSLIRRVE